MLMLSEDRKQKAIARISIRISRVYGLENSSPVFIQSIVEEELNKEGGQEQQAV